MFTMACVITSGQKCEHERWDRVHEIAKVYNIKTQVNGVPCFPWLQNVVVTSSTSRLYIYLVFSTA